MTQVWGQPVVADNAGANGVVAGEIAARRPAAALLLMVAMGHAINPLLYKKLPYDRTADFTPISLVATFRSSCWCVRAQANTSRSSSHCERLAAAHLCLGGNGSRSIWRALFEHMAGITMTHVAYKGGNPPARPDGGQCRHDDHPAQFRDPITTGKMRRAARARASAAGFSPTCRPAVRQAGRATSRSAGTV
jgi:tripartite-type tricarboxylate transporter receptor subunit TctC